MTLRTLIPMFACLVLALSLLAAGCMQAPAKPVPTTVPTPVPTILPETTAAPQACGFTTCHGMDLACGKNPPQVCTMEYRIGDKCRRYASCDTSSGGCTFVPGPKFIACKNCVEQCMIAAGPDSLAAFSCEEKC